MAGHSKWKNIQHRKGAQDAKRGKIFTKVIREITVAAKISDDPNSNPRLRAAIDKALSNNMTRDTIQRAIKRGAGGDDAANMVEIRYEGYGPGGIAVMVDCLTDNKNRTAGEVRHAFTKCNGQLGTDGSVAYLFSKKGLIYFAQGANEDRIMEIAIESGAEDVTVHDDGSIVVTTTPEHFSSVKQALEENGLKPEHAEIEMVASTEINIETLEQATELIKLTDMLEELDDVQNVHTNAQIKSEILEKIT